jgi:hypothetical protein
MHTHGRFYISLHSDEKDAAASISLPFVLPDCAAVASQRRWQNGLRTTRVAFLNAYGY